MTAAVKPPEVASIKSINKKLTANVGSRGLNEVFSDFCHMSALAIRNSVDLNGRADREERYLTMAKNYTPEQMRRFAEALSDVTSMLEAEFSDVLGRLFMSLELGSSSMGQFFTPYEVSLLMAQMQVDTMVEHCKTEEFVTLSEPTCGSGGMVVAVAESLRSAGVNFQQQLHVTAQDLSATAVHMAYIQLSLIGVPAVVIHGDTLAVECREAWFTPMHILGGWSRKMRHRSAHHPALEVMTEAPEPMAEPVDLWDSVFAEVAS